MTDRYDGEVRARLVALSAAEVAHDVEVVVASDASVVDELRICGVRGQHVAVRELRVDRAGRGREWDVATTNGQMRRRWQGCAAPGKGKRARTLRTTGTQVRL